MKKIIFKFIILSLLMIGGSVPSFGVTNTSGPGWTKAKCSCKFWIKAVNSSSRYKYKSAAHYGGSLLSNDTVGKSGSYPSFTYHFVAHETIPTTAEAIEHELGGNFSYVHNDSGKVVVIYDVVKSSRISVNKSNGDVTIKKNTPPGVYVVHYKLYSMSGTDKDRLEVSGKHTITITDDRKVYADTDYATFYESEAQRKISVKGNDSSDGKMSFYVSKIQNNPKHGKLVLWKRHLYYTPTPGYSGADKFRYRITGTSGKHAYAWVYITVTPAPTLTIPNVTVIEGKKMSLNLKLNKKYPLSLTYTLKYTNNTTNDDDHDAKTTVTTVVFPANTTSKSISIGTISDRFVEPNEYFTLSATKVNRTITNRHKDTGKCTITNDDQPPVAVDDYVTMDQDEEIIIYVLNNDKKFVSSDTLTVISTSNSDYGKAIVSKDGKTIKYIPNITVNGDNKFDYTISDEYGNTSTATVYINVIPDIPLDDFKKMFSKNLKGNLLIIGNSNLYNPSTGRTEYININKDRKDIFNSSSSRIDKIVDGVNVSKGKIVWAGLFWQGKFHNDSSERGKDKVYSFPYSQEESLDPMYRLARNHKITLNLSSGEKYTLSGEERHISYRKAAHTWRLVFDNEDDPYGWMYGYWNNWSNYHWEEESSSNSVEYVNFKNITSLLKGKGVVNKYTISNIATTTGQEKSGSFESDERTLGSWSLAIVYDNREEPMEEVRHVAFYGGYSSVRKWDSLYVNFKNFKTPSIAPNGVDAKLITVANNGYSNLKGDYIIMKDHNNKKFTFNNNYFKSKIDSNVRRTPVMNNTNGFDIHYEDIGSSSTHKVIKPKQTNAKLEVSSFNDDKFFVSNIGLTVELFKPKLCYDYDLVLGNNIKLEANDNRDIDSSNFGKNLSINVFLRSEVTDFDLENTTMDIRFKRNNKNSNSISYLKGSSYVSAINNKSYIKVPDLTSSGRIAIGSLNSKKTLGTIGALDSTYTKQKFVFKDGKFNGTFDIIVNGSVTYDGNEVIPYTLSTSGKGDSLIKRCAGNNTYEPIWGSFNVERTDSNVNQSDEVRYPLYTQVTGKDFSIDVRSYKKDANGKYTIPKRANTNINLDIIDASQFKNLNNSNSHNAYDSSCENPSSLSGTKLVKFRNTDKVMVNIPADIPDFNNDTAFKNIAFRIWYLGTYDENNEFSIVNHTCEKSGNCFKKLYIDEFEQNDGSKQCSISCKTHYTAGRCSDCLNENFSKPVCSRDNFAIRPASFRIALSDNGEVVNSSSDNLISVNSKNSYIKLAAEYDYDMDIRPVLYNKESASKSYFNLNYVKDSISDSAPKNKNEHILLASNNKSGCSDKNSYSYNYQIVDSKIYNSSLFEHNNVGEYSFNVMDNSWTEVDQASYKNKTQFNGIKTNDCVVEKAYNKPYIVGCNVDSNTFEKDDNFDLLKIKFNPYGFSLDEIDFDTLPWHNNKVLLNDFSHKYHEVNPITVASKFTGYLSAIGKDDTVLTNFTDTCYSKDVDLEIDRETFPVKEQDLVSKIGIVSKKDIFFQQHIKNVNSKSEILLGKDKIAVIKYSEFDNIIPGKAKVDLSLTYKKPLNSVVNPIRVDFKEVEVSSKTAQSYANKLKNYIPKGEAIYNQSVDYFFSKVTPYKKLYGPLIKNVVQTPLSVDLYCTDRPTASCVNFGLNISTVGLDENQYSWYTANVFGTNELGLFDLFSETTGGKKITIKSTETKSDKRINFNDNIATQKDIKITVGKSDIPSTVITTIMPDPWLLYDESDVKGYPSFDTQFIIESTWTGVGKTGKTIGGASDRNQKRRMHW